MKKFTINCQFGGQTAPFTVYIGNPESKHHPIHFQADWLSKERGGNVPAEVMNSLQKLLELAQKNNVPFEDLCTYALEAAQQPGEQQIADQNSAATQLENQQAQQQPTQPPSENPSNS
jgi:hypothetical protein